MKREGRTLVSRSSISEFRRCTKRNPEKKAGKKKSSGRSVGRSLSPSGDFFSLFFFWGGGEAASNASAKAGVRSGKKDGRRNVSHFSSSESRVKVRGRRGRRMGLKRMDVERETVSWSLLKARGRIGRADSKGKLVSALNCRFWIHTYKLISLVCVKSINGKLFTISLEKESGDTYSSC